eukprot:CAMPEP_0117030510 /NCGR_PEP_ID=MMETSP0472-20121206/22020_1 /TAXON_ID=693140 ORGANISM="Tiarina fusus, Strain LIS" /NCGR_SAMPLE_ID=MMETSP0472 /ASSEMBLY_ACC=CAM_ASM_000603 /LENGTH=240 /DNA_ID=CAMNT_0004738611 /DNA_START=56 /DNA_END=778 /DNA_ORIENTATION=-
MKLANALALPLFLLLSPVFARNKEDHNADFVKMLTQAKQKLIRSDFLEQGQTRSRLRGEGRKLAPIGIQVVESPEVLYFHGFLSDGMREEIFSTGPFTVYADCSNYRFERTSILLEIDGDDPLFVFGSISGDSNGNSDDIDDFVLPANGSYLEAMWSVDTARGSVDDDTGAFFATDGESADYISIFGDTTVGVYESLDDNSKDSAEDILESGAADNDQEDNSCFFAGGFAYYSDDLIVTV